MISFLFVVACTSSDKYPDGSATIDRSEWEPTTPTLPDTGGDGDTDTDTDVDTTDTADTDVPVDTDTDLPTDTDTDVPEVDPLTTDDDGDGFCEDLLACSDNSTPGDCDDNALTGAGVYPGAPEVCDGLDQDCDLVPDNNVVYSDYCADTDLDGHGDPNVVVNDCSQPAGHVLDCTDCSDTDPTAFVETDWYFDGDGDGFTDINVVSSSCGSPGLGWSVTQPTDCDDNDQDINPSEPEVCDGLDQDCDLAVDDGLLIPTWYADSDGDNYGDSDVSVQECTSPPEYVADNTDCDDNFASIYPGAPEVCDEVDQNCDLVPDDGLVIPVWYLDSDGDGYGDPAVSAQECAAPLDHVADATDCNDFEPLVNPGATEVGGDGIDNDCAGGDAPFDPCADEVFLLEDGLHTATVSGCATDLIVNNTTAFSTSGGDPQPGTGSWFVSQTVQGHTTNDLGPVLVDWPVNGTAPDGPFWSASLFEGTSGGNLTDECLGLEPLTAAVDYVVSFTALSTAPVDNTIELRVDGLALGTAVIVANEPERFVGIGYFTGTAGGLHVLELCTGSLQKLGGDVLISHVSVREATITP